MTPYEIPLSPQAQQFYISLGGTEYSLTVTWCAPSSCWLLAIADALGVPTVAGIPLVTGVDLLKQYAYLGIPGGLYVQTDADLYRVPNYSTLGVTGHLFFVVP